MPIACLEGNLTWARRPLRPLLPGQPAPQLLPILLPLLQQQPRGSRLRSLLPIPGSREPACVLAPPEPRCRPSPQDMEAQAERGYYGVHCNKGRGCVCWGGAETPPPGEAAGGLRSSSGLRQCPTPPPQPGEPSRPPWQIEGWRCRGISTTRDHCSQNSRKWAQGPEDQPAWGRLLWVQLWIS